MCGRKRLENPRKANTTIAINSYVAERVSIHARKIGENVSDFLERAIVNQMENDGDLDIRYEMKNIKGEDDD